MRYFIMALLALNIGYFGWSLLRPPAPQSGTAPQPLRNEGLQLVSEALAEAGGEAEHICLFVWGFADIFEASEFAGAVISDSLEATVYIAQPGDHAEVRLERIGEDPQTPSSGPAQWPDFAALNPALDPAPGSELTVAENACEMFAHAEHFH